MNPPGATLPMVQCGTLWYSNFSIFLCFRQNCRSLVIACFTPPPPIVNNACFEYPKLQPNTIIVGDLYRVCTHFDI